MNHFDLFGLPTRFDLDPTALEQKYRALSLQHHPDRVSSAGASERRVALERTTALNDAYSVLKHTERRAFYLLKLSGVDLDREDAGAQKDMPLEFLEEVMTLREGLDEARAASDLGRISSMGKEVEAQKTAALNTATAALRTLEREPTDAAARTLAAHQLGRVRYFARFLEEVERLEEQALS